jgi:hypothetical protein
MDFNAEILHPGKSGVEGAFLSADQQASGLAGQRLDESGSWLDLRREETRAMGRPTTLK